ncbi:MULTISPECIES: carbohydrate ABC transporter permease [unclassified Paenibacillus]|uniref:carbohydrate ABC transporter permease n=1 Tax=unclassified Paenibacillus TaxID=185978 RepID=UPI0024074886|nr:MULTISPECIES: carbohydrate ABC transporter permease [unclassified Paenibacillus]MDF9843679.1 putative aldouronate transport system permease protein [Paenibacillus sp. PastF-2]MDF9850267.1 putative aldouronate transport system permease protein [Paenibacillus sp. PastM-2]MDF9856793.1 putative aldouronate transport system permease protein [Paenibacillus sp. PastF-1]MDH6482114.1 putative aldouronate transport system permease protein [Paenibacillus sp. PastH-2]MDH6509536.1 putative aldouronate t
MSSMEAEPATKSRRRFSRKSRMQVSTADKLISITIYVLFSLFTFICIYPFYSIIINTISANDLSAKGEIIFLPKQIHFQNYIDVFKIPGLWNAFVISLGRTVIGTLLTVGASAFLGFMFSQEDMWGRKFWYRFTIITMFFNAGIIPWYLTMRSLHLTNNFLAYILPTIVAPFFIILVKTFVESTPKELQQAASIDGAGTMTIFFKIILPISKPILATVAIFSAVNQWNSFQDTLLLVTDSKLYSLQFILYNYINQASSLSTMVNLQNAGSTAMASLATKQTTTSIRMTVTIIVVAPILLVYPFFQRFFVKGIIIGAVKG